MDFIYGYFFYRTTIIKDYFLTITEPNFHLNFHQTSAFLGVEKWKLPVVKWNLRVFKGRKLETSSFEGWKLPQKRWKFWINFHFWKWKFTRSLLETSSKLPVKKELIVKILSLYDKKIVKILSKIVKILSPYDKKIVKILSPYDKKNNPKK